MASGNRIYMAYYRLLKAPRKPTKHNFSEANCCLNGKIMVSKPGQTAIQMQS